MFLVLIHCSYLLNVTFSTVTVNVNQGGHTKQINTLVNMCILNTVLYKILLVISYSAKWFKFKKKKKNSNIYHLSNLSLFILEKERGTHHHAPSASKDIYIDGFEKRIFIINNLSKLLLYIVWSLLSITTTM